MEITKCKELLALGLKNGFAGKTVFNHLSRGSFALTSSHFEDSEGVYHDEWIDGGGQELARVDNISFTRTYVGATVSEKKLIELGISKDDVLKFLVKIITNYANVIRFDEDFTFEDQNWKYSYIVSFKSDEPFIINGIEKITHNSEIVFIHTFGISRIVDNE